MCFKIHQMRRQYYSAKQGAWLLDRVKCRGRCRYTASRNQCRRVLVYTRRCNCTTPVTWLRVRIKYTHMSRATTTTWITTRDTAQTMFNDFMHISSNGDTMQVTSIPRHMRTPILHTIHHLLSGPFLMIPTRNFPHRTLFKIPRHEYPAGNHSEQAPLRLSRAPGRARGNKSFCRLY